jgi:hypothetical protein
MCEHALLVPTFSPSLYCSRIGKNWKEWRRARFLYLALFISVYTWVCARLDHTVLALGMLALPLQLRSALVLVYGVLGQRLIGLEKETAPLILRIDVSDVVFYSLEAPA